MTDLDLDHALFEAAETSEKRLLDLPGLMPGARYQRLNCRKGRDSLLIEGDIALSPAPPLHMIAAMRNHVLEGFGLGIGSKHYLWPDGVIPVVVSDDIREQVEGAIDHISRKTPIRFPPRGHNQRYVSFVPDEDENSSPIGMRNNRQRIRLVPGGRTGTAVHEICHTLGLWHEHSRPDRAEHIRVHEGRISEEGKKQFGIPIEGLEPIGPYDVNSIMHYTSFEFSSTGEPTITMLDGQTLLPRNGLSSGDIASLQELYPGLEWPSRQ